jgi:hypothetical protein
MREFFFTIYAKINRCIFELCTVVCTIHSTLYSTEIFPHRNPVSEPLIPITSIRNAFGHRRRGGGGEGGLALYFIIQIVSYCGGRKIRQLKGQIIERTEKGFNC